jgi:c-di-GMP-binding flagellar brake protein YcgR
MGTTVERRRYERVPFFTAVEIRDFKSGRALPARTLELSIGGVGLVTNGAFLPGDDVTIMFHVQNAGFKRATEVAGRVIGFSADSDANRVGVEFSEPLSMSRAPELVRRLQQM